MVPVAMHCHGCPLTLHRRYACGKEISEGKITESPKLSLETDLEPAEARQRLSVWSGRSAEINEDNEDPLCLCAIDTKWWTVWC